MGRATVLVMMEGPLECRAFANRIRAAGHEVIETTNSIAANTVLQRRLDIRVAFLAAYDPNGSGFMVARQLRDPRLSVVPIIIAASREQAAAAAKMYSGDAYAFVLDTADSKTLGIAIDDALRREPDAGGMDPDEHFCVPSDYETFIVENLLRLVRNSASTPSFARPEAVRAEVIRHHCFRTGLPDISTREAGRCWTEVLDACGIRSMNSIAFAIARSVSLDPCRPFSDPLTYADWVVARLAQQSGEEDDGEDLLVVRLRIAGKSAAQICTALRLKRRAERARLGRGLETLNLSRLSVYPAAVASTFGSRLRVVGRA